MSAGSAWAQVSAGRAVDTQDAPWQEEDPRQDRTPAHPAGFATEIASSGGHFPVARAAEAASETSFLCALWERALYFCLKPLGECGGGGVSTVSHRGEKAVLLFQSRQVRSIGGEPSIPTTEGGRKPVWGSSARKCRCRCFDSGPRRALGPLGEAAFNQGWARSSSEVLAKVSAAAERETPFPAIWRPHGRSARS